MFIGKRKKSVVANLVFGISILLGLAALIMVYGAALGLWEPIDGFGYSRSYNDTLGYIVC